MAHRSHGRSDSLGVDVSGDCHINPMAGRFVDSLSLWVIYPVWVSLTHRLVQLRLAVFGPLTTDSMIDVFTPSLVDSVTDCVVVRITVYVMVLFIFAILIRRCVD